MHQPNRPEKYFILTKDIISDSDDEEIDSALLKKLTAPAEWLRKVQDSAIELLIGKRKQGPALPQQTPYSPQFRLVSQQLKTLATCPPAYQTPATISVGKKVTKQRIQQLADTLAAKV